MQTFCQYMSVDTSLVENYRPISMQSVVGKMFKSVAMSELFHVLRVDVVEKQHYN